MNSLSGDLRAREDRYGVLGSRLFELGSGPRGELRASLAELASHAFAGRIAVLMEQYDRFSGKPAAWGDDCITAIEYAKARLATPGFWLPADVPQVEEDLAAYLRSCGEILSAWPAAFEAAARWAAELLETARVK